ncbi:NrfD/PsrC family molybdoenzyme membrane anchor subunit [Candidatus Methanoperedens nitratireducens]|uniref:Polysulphide reductase NrfD n=1 Tax=Candidatus Methanoperedens nitratireducens TaxID=1392998 RepID=A0A284VQN4_9EURY|nr:NrfD/PsrC family molybdoenzyme membrane anchor subunit [Candidatus Methanoperedens nitroreducens]SNQ61601.1 Polysulphide reductase NrfD [Candidatus Methanoperedens nitroreducens]
MEYTKIEGKSIGFYGIIALFGILIAIGLFEFVQGMRFGQEDYGTSNIVPWGLPITAVIFLIGASAGALMLSSLTYVFGKEEYKPVSRISIFLAILLLIGALSTIEGELGRPERFMNLMIYGPQNLTSMFAVNTFLYGAYIILSIVYLWTTFRADLLKVTKILGAAAAALAIFVHAGTGSIFGFIVAKELWFSPLLPVLFIVAALTSGVALLILILTATFKFTGRSMDENLVVGLGKYLTAFLLLQLFLVFIENMVRIYGGIGGGEMTKFLFAGPYSFVFWGIQIFLGTIIPIAILFARKTMVTVQIASLLAVIGVFAERFSLVIPGQSVPPQQVVGRALMGFYGEPAIYSISGAEVAIILGVIGAIGILYLIGLRVIKLLPS